MRLGLRELVRKPGRFAVATATLTLIAILLMFLSGLVDGLVRLATGAYLAQPAQLLVLSDDAKGVLAASALTTEQREAVAKAAPGAEIGGVGSITLGARVGDEQSRDITSVQLRGYELPPAGLPTPPPAGEVWADADLDLVFDVGETLLLGGGRYRVRLAGFVGKDANPALGGLWASLDTWRAATESARPGQTLPADFVQGLVVATPDTELGRLASSIDTATGTTQTRTIPDAAAALPGVSAQQTTFWQIIGITVVVALLVVALFFALLTAERKPLYGVLKALGATNRALFAGVVVQALVLAAIAAAIGVGVTVLAVALIPPRTVPFWPSVGGIAGGVGLIALAAVLGSVFSLRTVLRVDPAAAIGGN